VLTAGGTRIAPEGTSIRNPRLDRTPASLLSAIVTEEGVVQAPFDEGLAAHVAAAEARRASVPGFAAHLARRVGAAS
jgi:methylthioribose-1-phosphate isomerase